MGAANVLADDTPVAPPDPNLSNQNVTNPDLSNPDTSRAPAAADESAMLPEQKSEAEAQPPVQGLQINVQDWAIRPSAGIVEYNSRSQFAGGLLFDVNILETSWMRLGPATGALFSSYSGTGYFNGINGSNDTYFFQVPANLKATFYPEDSKRLGVAVHGGANMIYSTQTLTVVNNGAFGKSGNGAQSNSSWDAHGNVGGDISYLVTKNFDISIRPDVTFFPDFNMFTGTLGLALKL
jgi:hypothetical protein